MATIRKAVIPVAGLGTRFLPATKAQPKEMLTLVDKPVIQHIVEECVAAGIEQVIFVTSHNKRAIEDHFDSNFELEHLLRQRGKIKELEAVTKVTNLASFVYVRQNEPKGDGQAILLTRELVGDEPVAVLYGDDVVDSEVPCIGQLISVFERYRDPVIAVEKVPKSEISNYGVISGRQVVDRTWEVDELVEKPSPGEAPSDLAIIGRYIITPEVFSALERAEPSKGGEIRLIDAFRSIRRERSIFAHEFRGQRFDCGNKLQFLAASIHYGLKHPEVNPGGEFSHYLKNRCQEI
jgi:UTP--glucose-1-phosphate uridylyltransferase